MKNIFWSLTLIASLLLAGIGCNKSGGSVDAAPVEKAFASAEPTLKATADTVVKALKSGDYASALPELQKLAAQANLTPEQQAAIKGVIEQVQKALSTGAANAGKDASKAIGDAQKAIGK